MRFIHVIVFILPPFIYLLFVCLCFKCWCFDLECVSPGQWDWGKKVRLGEDEKRCWEIHYYAVMLQHRLWRDTAHHSAFVHMRHCASDQSMKGRKEKECLPRSFPSLDFHSVRVCTMASHLSLTDRRNEVKAKCRSNHWRTKSSISNITNTGL